jgi:hypothetical protein
MTSFIARASIIAALAIFGVGRGVAFAQDPNDISIELAAASLSSQGSDVAPLITISEYMDVRAAAPTPRLLTHGR